MVASGDVTQALRHGITMTNALNGFEPRGLLARSGVASDRNLYWYYKEADGLNFGDWIGPYIFGKLTGHRPYFRDARRRGLGAYHLTCGSILGHIRQSGKAIVWGSGAIKPDASFPAPKIIHAVRGPLSREICIRLGHRCPEVYGDPGILLPQFYTPTTRRTKHRLGIVPHFKDLELALALFGNREDVLIVDVRRNVEPVVDDIASCEAVVSSSLHGIILAQAYGLPAARIVLSDKVIGGNFKFDDYFLGAELAPPQKPIVVDQHRPPATKELTDAALASGVVDLAPVARRLLKACPFAPADRVELHTS